jgi:hypothetical protein
VAGSKPSPQLMLGSFYIRRERLAASHIRVSPRLRRNETAAGFGRTRKPRPPTAIVPVTVSQKAVFGACRRVINLPGAGRRNILCRMADPTQAPTTSPAFLSKTKVLVIKLIALTAISLALISAQGWAAPRCYRADYVAGFYTGLLEGALMPAALPGLLGGHDVPIYAPNNDGRGYKIGFILGLNACGTFFFGVAFWQPRRRK